MADQSFERYTRREKPSRPRFRTFLARLVTFGGALALTVYATREMIEVVSVGGVTMLQGVMVVLFAITFGWIALAAALLNLVRPSIVLMSIALAAGGFGLVLHNAGLAGLAVALLILSLARPAPAVE